tara:strand:+ start:690 stop:1043 length:354 start_codon:yes stop_codon:yes gene_type:complete
MFLAFPIKRYPQPYEVNMALVKAVSQDGTIIFARDSDEITDTNTIAKYYKGIDCSGEVRLFSKLTRLDGPARIGRDGSLKWFYCGTDISEMVQGILSDGDLDSDDDYKLLMNLLLNS